MESPARTAGSILLIEDDPADAARFVRIAERMACDVTTCDTPGDALLVLHNRTPDIVVIDLNIRDDDGARFLQGGLKVCAEVRRKTTYDGPIVFLTGMKDRELLKYCFELGGDDYILKSEPAEVLSQRLRFWFDPAKAAPNGLMARRNELLQGVLADIAAGRDPYSE